MAIKIDKLSFSYGDKKVFEDYSLEINDSEIVVIMGPSGKGKTTLLKLIAGLLKPDSGSIEGNDKNIGMVFQEDRLVEELSAVANVRLANDISKEKIEEYLTKVGLEEEMNKPVKELSGGQKRRVALVRAIAGDRDIIIMDEPFTGLDTKLTDTIIDYICDIMNNKTLIIVTHDEEDAKQLGGRIITL